MSEDDDMPARELFSARSNFFEFLLNGRRRRQECSSESVRVSLLPRIDVLILFEDFSATTGTYEVRHLMGRGLNTPFPRMTCVQKHASAERFIKSKESRHPTVKPSDVNTHA